MVLIFAHLQVRTWKMHLFTAIQILCLATLWAVKSTTAAVAFPFVLIMMIPVRKFVLPCIFTAKELRHLDQSGGRNDADEDDDMDFYEEARMANVRHGSRNSDTKDT